MRRIIRWSVSAATACGLAAGLAPPAVAGEDPVIKAPTLLTLRLDAPTATVTFRDRSDPDVLHYITLTEKENPGYTKIVRQAPGNVPGVGRVATRSVTGIKPGVAYCATVAVEVAHPDPVLYDLEDPVSEPSNKVCAEPTDPAKPQSAPSDLSVGPITGEAKPVMGTNRTYWVQYTNRGAEVKGAVIEVWATGPLQLRRPPDSGTFSGFTCAAAGAAGFRCTGGTVKTGEKGQIPFLAAVARTGSGTIHASITGAGDANTADNGSKLDIQAISRAS
ncbi:hypothetical protein [Streptomyces sp. NPDC051211]|uniref:hypothetical protein n=1 Tax=Streptomyces sp. NPDC051211 TaxID=3154643 RepID=UPI00344B7289